MILMILLLILGFNYCVFKISSRCSRLEEKLSKDIRNE